MTDFSGLRSLLFVPGSDTHRFERALDSGADAVIFDLEDSVLPERKEEARSLVVSALNRLSGNAARLVRVNAPDSPWGLDDVAAFDALSVDGLVLPKADPARVVALGPEGSPVIAIIETAAGLKAAYQVAQQPRVKALALGGADLAAELGQQTRADGLELIYARSSIVLDSAAAGIRAPFDVVHLNTKDGDGLRGEATLARSLGFGGKLCIHPAQVAAVNEAFSPSPEELAEAGEIVVAYEAARNHGAGVSVWRGRMLDLPVVLRARATLACGRMREAANRRTTYGN